ncbi:MAG: SurA N-terminal domain-containing protein [Candidatus Paceibacterota bacterium]
MENETNQSQPLAPQKNTGLIYATIGIVLLLTLGAAYLLTQDMDNGGDTQPIENGEEQQTGPVAIVNGEEIPREIFNQNLEQFRASVSETERESLDAQIQQQVLNTLINNTLIRQEIEEQGLTADDVAVQTEFEAIQENAGGAEELQTQLDAAGLTEAELRAQIAEQVVINTYLESVVNIENVEVTEEEIQSFYDELSAENQELPPLEEVRDQIEQQLRAQKQQEEIGTVLETLRADADIEILI